MKNILSITIATFLVFTAAPEAEAGSVKIDWLIKKLKACRWNKHCWDDPPAPPPSPSPCVPVCSPDGQWCKTCEGGAVDPFDLPITGNGIVVLDVQADGSETMIFRGIEGAQGVWLAGRPSSAAWGLHYRSWAELARERPGLRPCGTRKSDDPFGPVEIYIVLRPIADLEGSTP